MRQTPSGCLCSSTLWLRMEGGSNQKQRSVGQSRVHRHVGDQEAVAEDAALALLAEQLRARCERAPSQAAT